MPLLIKVLEQLNYKNLEVLSLDAKSGAILDMVLAYQKDFKDLTTIQLCLA
jgi:hypothetical protein